MADENGNPTEPTDPRYQQPSPIKPVAPAPRVNPPNINSGKESSPASGPAGFGDFMEWMRIQMGGTVAPAETQRTLIPKEKKKFQRREADKAAVPTEEADDSPKPVVPLVPEKTVATPVAAASVARELPGKESEAARPPGPPAGDPAELLAPRLRRGQQAAAKRNPWIGLSIQVAALALLAGCFFLGRASVQRTVAEPTAAPAAPVVVDKEGKTTTRLLSDANAALIDQAMAAEQASDFKKAGELLQQVKASGQHVYGLAFQLAQLAVFANENTRAGPLLNDALNAGEELASVYNLRATVAARASVFRDNGNNDYETAAKIDPFDARIFYYWGVVLRRSGKSQAALKRLQQALDRLREPTAEGLYRLDMRLTLIELGREKEFAEDLARQMALPNPGIDWLFTAAALAVRDGRFADAAALLTRAQQLGDTDAFSLRIRDYFFAQHRFEKELKAFFDSLNPARPDLVPPPPAPAGSPSPENAAPPAIGLDVPVLPPPASPGATMPPH